VNAVEKIFPKTAQPHHGRQVTVGGCNDAYIDGDGVYAAYAGDFFFLQHTQQAGLQQQGHFAHFVQKQCAAICRFKQPCLAVPSCACKSTFFVPEKLGLQQVLRKRAAIGGDERMLPPSACLMNALCHNFLARAAFPLDQHRGIAVFGQYLAAPDQFTH